MVITGALLIGHSLRAHLEEVAAATLGGVKTALTTPDHRITLATIDRLAGDPSGRYAPMLSTDAFLRSPQMNTSAEVTLHGIGPDYFRLAGTPHAPVPASVPAPAPASVPVPAPALTPSSAPAPTSIRPGEILLNTTAATHLQVKPGDDVILRFFHQTGISGDSPFSLARSDVATTRLRVAGIFDAHSGGDFSLQVSQRLPRNGFVDIRFLGDLMGTPNRANVVISDREEGLAKKLATVFRPADYGLSLQPGGDQTLLRYDGVFIPDPLERVIDRMNLPKTKVFAYFINAFQANHRTVPYSFIAGIEEPPLPPDCASDGILINEWLAEQLGASTGSSMRITAYKPGPAGTLPEQENQFRVVGIASMTGPALDPSFIPLFPGMKDAATCGDWDPALPIDLKRIRPADEAYWNKYGGLPKAFIRLNTARKLWESRFGGLTLVRFPGRDVDEVGGALEHSLKESSLPGTEVMLSREKRHGSAYSVDFGMLFGGLGFFLILAALALTDLLFGLYLEKRRQELVILKVIGFSRRDLGRILGMEALVIALIGATAGLLPGIAYAGTLLHFLGSVWRGAVNITQIPLRVSAFSLLTGFAAALLVCAASLAVSRRAFFLSSEGDLLSREDDIRLPPQSSGQYFWLFLLPPGILPFVVSDRDGGTAAALFFLAGLSMLAFTTQAAKAFLTYLGNAQTREPGHLSISTLAAKNALRRFDRSMAVVRVTACAIFLIAAVSAHHRGPPGDPHRPDSGTGGFAWYLETTIPMTSDFNSPSGRYAHKLEALPTGTIILHLPLLDGSDGSCLNLNRVLRPGVLGIDPTAVAGRFVFSSALGNRTPGWHLLDEDFGDPRIIPAIGDADVIRWNLGLSLGDDIPYEFSPGQGFRLKLVGSLAGSTLQGRLLVSRENFYRLRPEAVGSKVLLVAPPRGEEAVTGALLATALQRYGCHLESGSGRLAEFNRVQNTYLSIFLALGVLGMILGCAALAVLLHGNLLERQEELALLRALGYPQSLVVDLVFREHAVLFFTGLVAGLMAATVVIIPLFFTSSGQVPLGEIAFGILLILLAGPMALYTGILAGSKNGLIPCTKEKSAR
jgi:ABC-type lipoprotein release transport system permease subunit